MGVWKVGVSLRIREDLREEMMGFAKSEKRSFGNLGAVLLEWSVEKLKAAGGTSELFGSYSMRLNNVIRTGEREGQEVSDGRMERAVKSSCPTRPTPRHGSLCRAREKEVRQCR